MLVYDAIVFGLKYIFLKVLETLFSFFTNGYWIERVFS